jgi:Na+/melibiose symporter-like transporter
VAAGRYERGFRRLWAATSLSGLGDGARIASFAVLAATLTHDPLQVALVTVAARVPWVLVGPFTGALVDRVPHWRTMWLCDVVRAVLMSLFVVLLALGQVGIGLLVCVSFLLSSIDTLAENLAQAVVPQVAGTVSLETANSRIMGGQLVAGEFIGTAAGTALFALSAPLPFAVDAATFLAAALLVRSVRPVPGQAAERGHPLPSSGIFAEVAEGFRWLWRHRTLRTVCLLIGLLNFCVLTVMGIAVLYALNVLHISAAAYGAALVVIGLGGLAGLLVAPACVARLGRGGTLKLALGLAPAPFLIAGLTSDVLVAASGLTLVGASITLATVVTTALRQDLIPQPLFGRVNSAYRLVINGVSPLGGLAGGVLAGVLGLRAPFILAGSVMAVAALVGLCLSITDSTTSGAAGPDAARMSGQSTDGSKGNV